MEVTAAVLRNKGVPVPVNRLTGSAAEGWSVVLGEDGEPVREDRFVKFDFNAIADIEERFGGTTAWENAMGGDTDAEGSPIGVVRAIRTTLSICWEEPEPLVGKRLIMSEFMNYTVGLGMAWALANGVDPTTAAKRLNEAYETIAKGAEALRGATDVDEPETATEAPLSESPGEA